MNVCMYVCMYVYVCARLCMCVCVCMLWPPPPAAEFLYPPLSPMHHTPLDSIFQAWGRGGVVSNFSPSETDERARKGGE